MKSLNLTITQHGDKCVTQAVISDDTNGGSAVPTFGVDALRLALRYLEELSEATITGDVTHHAMMNNGRTFEELRAEKAKAGAR